MSEQTGRRYRRQDDIVSRHIAGETILVPVTARLADMQRIYALNAVLPLLPAKQRQLNENDWLERDVLVACPDPEEGLIMRIERIARRTMDSDELT